MKKSLLFAALVMGAMSVNAQSEKVLVDVDALGLTADLSSMEAGKIVASSENVEMSLAFADQVKAASLDVSGYNTVVVNGEAVEMPVGFTGNSNPKGQVLAGKDASTPSNQGFVLKFNVKKDGYLTIFGKMTANKEYQAWEGDETAATPLSYTFAMDWTQGVTDAGAPVNKLVYTLPADDMGYLDFDAADIDKYLNGNKLYFPEEIVLNNQGGTTYTKGGLGVIIIPVYADAGTYLVHAVGSKITTSGALFTTEPVTSLSVTGTDTEGTPIENVLISGEGTGIGGITVNGESNDNAPVYNLAGQRVNNNVKGILIRDGKKFINK